MVAACVHRTGAAEAVIRELALNARNERFDARLTLAFLQRVDEIRAFRESLCDQLAALVGIAVATVETVHTTGDLDAVIKGSALVFACTITYADGSSREFYRIGLSANTTGISVYVFGLDDKSYLARTYGGSIGKARVTGYCIKFRHLAVVNVDVLQAG